MSIIITSETRKREQPGIPERCGAFLGASVDTPRDDLCQCPEPSVMTVMTPCQCSHSALRPSCAEHGMPGEHQICSPCAAIGHSCPVEVVRVA